MIRLAIIAALSLPQASLAQSISGIAHAVDGDSLEVGSTEVRLHGIDAPEYRQTCQVNYSAWTCGADAAKALRTLIDNRLITCIPRDRDVYGRTVANCMIGDRDIAAEIVRQGYAVVLDSGQADYAAVEARAKVAKVGVWASTFDMPVDWRRSHPREPDTKPNADTRQWNAPVQRQPISATYLYRSCAAARAAGAAPMYRGRATYNPNLDGDGDGIACEPYRGRR